MAARRDLSSFRCGHPYIHKCTICKKGALQKCCNALIIMFYRVSTAAFSAAMPLRKRAM